MEGVLDCSVALAWVLPDETSARADKFLAHLSPQSVLYVPALWWYEISNALTMAQRRHRLAESESKRVVEIYSTLPIKTDVDLSLDVVRRIQALAREYSLSAYDAAYLELAERRNVGLATLDRRLTAAARKAGVKILSA